MKLNLKTVLTGSAATVALVAASSANASGYYVGLFGGISTMEDDFNVATSTSRSSSDAASPSIVFKGAGTVNTGYAAWTSKDAWDTQPNYNPSKSGTAGAKYGTFFASTSAAYLRKYSIYNTHTTLATSMAMSAHGSFDDGFVVGGSIGWDFGNGWRTELEAAYRANDLSSSPVNGVRTWAFNQTDSHYRILVVPYGQTYYTKFLTYVGLNYVTLTTPIASFTSKTKFPYTTGGATTATPYLNYINNGHVLSGFPGTGSTPVPLYGTTQVKFADAGGTAGVIGSVDGKLETWSFMFNIWHDFDFGDSPIHPFIGGGVGFANASLDYTFTATIPALTYGSYTNVALGTAAFGYRGNGEATDWGFAYQLGAGLGYDFGNGMMLSAQYRYFNTGAMDLSLRDQIEVNLESHNFLVGLNIPIGGGM